MEPSCVPQTLIPGTSRLFRDYLYRFDKVERFYSSHFLDDGALVESARQLRYPESRRQQIVEALRRQNGDSAALEQLAQPGTVAVVTGQQVGLFSGPAYTIFKALTAVKIAEHLRQEGTAAVPIFWLATEDHDLAEVDHAWVFDHTTTPTRLALPGVENGGPVGQVELGSIPIEELRRSLGDLPFADEVVNRIERAYQPGATLGGAFRSLLQDLLKDFGLLYLDPLAPQVREIAADFIRQTVDGVPDLIPALQQRSQELESSGYHVQVLVERDTSLLFLLSGGKRIPIRWKQGRFVAKDQSYTAAELKAMANQISPNALLRPVMQDYLLPTVTYVGGPAEIAYLAQSETLYRALLGRMPVIFPRNSFTLIDKRASKLLDRYALHIPDLFVYREKVVSDIAARVVPAGLREEFARLRSGISDSLERLQSDLLGFEPTLERAAQKSAAKILYQLSKLDRKASRAALERDEQAQRDAYYLTNLIYPHRRLQERFYSIVPFLAKHGLDLPARLFEQTQLVCADHMVRTV